MLTLVGDFAFILVLMFFFALCAVGLVLALAPTKEATPTKADALALMRRAITCEDAAILMRDHELEAECHATYLDARAIWLALDR